MIRAAVLGSPISHSLSPLLHRTAYQLLGIEATYSAHEVVSGQLRKFLDHEGSDLNSISLTMPLKEEALTIADSVSDISRQIQSGNTLHKVSGKWNLTSTDVEGFSNALLFHKVVPDGATLIIGAGATARAVVAACDGISKSITLVNRNPSRERSIRKTASHTKIAFLPWDVSIDFANFDLIVNTTPGTTASVFIDHITVTPGVFFDVLYKPWPTPLLSKWRSAGGYGIDGLDLLIHQAISQVEIFAATTVNRVELAQRLRSEGEKALS
jgi:shikimate dehydrogenase